LDPESTLGVVTCIKVVLKFHVAEFYKLSNVYVFGYLHSQAIFNCFLKDMYGQCKKKIR